MLTFGFGNILWFRNLMLPLFFWDLFPWLRIVPCYAKIKYLQSDAYSEFIGKSLQALFSKLGIIHQLSCLGTSKKNGLAEHKHYHIVETGLTLLVPSHMHSRFWNHVFFRCHLLNRMATLVLNFKSPFTYFWNSTWFLLITCFWVVVLSMSNSFWSNQATI